MFRRKAAPFLVVFLAIATAAAPGALAGTDIYVGGNWLDSHPGRVDMCLTHRQVPLVREVRIDIVNVESRSVDLNNAVDQLKKSCTDYNASPTQTGPLLDAVNAGLADVKAKSDTFSAASDALSAKELQAWKALGHLGETQCQKEMGVARGKLPRNKAAVVQMVSTACNSRADRASTISGLGGAAQMDNQRAQDAILDPKAHRADSSALLQQAHSYALSHGLPDPSVSANDTICGEACVAMLRVQMAESQQGASSDDYAEAVVYAKYTKPSIFGYLN